jgi:RHS repeat-associated protein
VFNERESTEFAYDDLSRLVRAHLAGGRAVHYTYDPLFRRRTVETGNAVRRTIWALDVPLEEQLAEGGRIRYVYDMTTEAALMIEIAGAWHVVVRDSHGDVSDLIRIRDEKIVWSAESLGFETAILANDLPLPMPLRGPGQLFDEELGLVYQRARYYVPREGRFLTPDPLGPAGGPNPFAYCLNQPLLWIDPRGLNPCLSREECEEIRGRIQRTGKEVSERWEEMRNPKSILPFNGPSRAAGRRAAGKAVAPGAQGAPNFGTKGTVASHIDAYENAQAGLNQNFREYDMGQCGRFESAKERKDMQRFRKLRNKKPELHPDYGHAGNLPSNLRGRVTIAS